MPNSSPCDGSRVKPFARLPKGDCLLPWRSVREVCLWGPYGSGTLSCLDPFRRRVKTELFKQAIKSSLNPFYSALLLFSMLHVDFYIVFILTHY